MNERNRKELVSQEDLRCYCASESVICVAETPFQLLSISAFIMQRLQEEEADSFEADLLIRENFSAVSLVNEIAVSLNLFRRIVRVEFSEPLSDHAIRQYYLETVFRSNKRKKLLESATGICSTKKYSGLICTTVSALTRDVKKYYVKRDGFTILCDDGAGSHTGTLYDSNLMVDDILSLRQSCKSRIPAMKNMAKSFIQMLAPATWHYNVVGIALAHAGRYERSVYASDIPIISIDRGMTDVLEEMSACPLKDGRDTYTSNRVVFLSLPGDLPASTLESERDLMLLAGDVWPTDVVVRQHPRRERLERCQSCFEVDDGTSIWEILVSNSIINQNHILIGFPSTAFFAPKNLLGVEPRIVLLHKLIDTGYPLQPYERITQMLLSSYERDERIAVPQTVSQLVQILKKWRKEDETINI